MPSKYTDPQSKTSDIKKDRSQWSLEDIRLGLNNFYKEYGRYPTATEVDRYEHLPTSRQIQRKFGGLVKLRETLGLSGQHDFTRGEHSSKRATQIERTASKLKIEVCRYLSDRFGKPSVIQEHLLGDDRRTRIDFFVSYKGGQFSVDVFHPKDMHSLICCLNSKQNTYKKLSSTTLPVIFLLMNDLIDKDDLVKALQNKKRKLEQYQQVMFFDQFKKFCSNKQALKTQ